MLLSNVVIQAGFNSIAINHGSHFTVFAKNACRKSLCESFCVNFHRSIISIHLRISLKTKHILEEYSKLKKIRVQSEMNSGKY